MIALICDSWENFWREVLSPWGEIKTFSDGVTLAYYLQHGGPCDLAVVAVDGASRKIPCTASWDHPAALGDRRQNHWQGGSPLPPEGPLRGLIPLVPHFYMEAI